MRRLTEQEYKASDAVNYSLLRCLAKSPLEAKAFIDKTNAGVKAAHFTWGSLIDCLLTTPDQLDTLFFLIPSGKVPMDKMLVWADEVWRLSQGVVESITEDMILEARVTADYNKRLTNETAIAKFKTESMIYLMTLATAGERDVISSGLLSEAKIMVEKVKANSFLKMFFNHIYCEGAITEYQYAVEFTIGVSKEVLCKAKLDQVVKRPDRTAHVIDYKTCRNIDEFAKSYLEYGYPIQGAMYTEAMYSHPDIDTVTFSFVVMGRDGRVLIYQMSTDELLKAGNKPKTGIYDLLDEYVFHKESGLWEYTKEQYENNGIIKLNEL